MRFSYFNYLMTSLLVLGSYFLLNLRLCFPGLGGKGYMGQTGATMTQVMEDHLMKKRYKYLKAGNIPTCFQSAN
jgi:hypothetical protein